MKPFPSLMFPMRSLLRDELCPSKIKFFVTQRYSSGTVRVKRPAYSPLCCCCCHYIHKTMLSFSSKTSFFTLAWGGKQEREFLLICVQNTPLYTYSAQSFHPKTGATAAFSPGESHHILENKIGVFSLSNHMIHDNLSIGNSRKNSKETKERLLFTVGNAYAFTSECRFLQRAAGMALTETHSPSSQGKELYVSSVTESELFQTWLVCSVPGRTPTEWSDQNDIFIWVKWSIYPLKHIYSSLQEALHI